jgi:preprotein translocase subunit SecY
MEAVFLNRILLWLIVAAVLMIGLVLYLSRSGRSLNVDQHAREEIEKAKRR